MGGRGEVRGWSMETKQLLFKLKKKKKSFILVNLLCNICGGWSRMVINQVLCFRKVNTVSSINEWSYFCIHD